MFGETYMWIYAFVLPSILGASHPRYSVIQLQPGLLLFNEKAKFQDIRRNCTQLNGTLISPVNYTDSIPTNISSLWTGTYTTKSDWIAYVGCFPVNVAMYPDIYTKRYSSSLEDNSPGKCQKYCSCYKFIALQGIWCICIESYSGTSNLGRCTKKCNGSTKHRCGGETHASVYKTMRFQRDCSQDDEHCISSQSLNNTIVLRSNECNASKQYKCAAHWRSSSQKVSWITGADDCSNRTSILETFITNTTPAAKDETWTGLFRENIQLHVGERNVYSIERLQAKRLACNHRLYNVTLFSENKTKNKECSNEKITSTEGYVDLKSKVQTQTSDISMFITEDTFSSKVITDTSVGHVNILSTGNSLQPKLHTETRPANYTPGTTIKMAERCLICDDKNQKSDAVNTGLIAGIVAGVVVLVVVLVILALWRRKKRQVTQRRKKDYNSKRIINNSYDQRMVTINQKENNQNTKDSRDEYSYAYMQSQNSADVLTKSGGEKNGATDDIFVYDHLNSKPMPNTNISDIYDTSKTHDDGSYDSFTITRKNVSLDDIYSHTCIKVNMDDHEYGHLHTKPLSRHNTDDYDHI